MRHGLHRSKLNLDLLKPGRSGAELLEIATAEERRVRARMAAHLRKLAKGIQDAPLDQIKLIARLCKDTGI